MTEPERIYAWVYDDGDRVHHNWSDAATYGALQTEYVRADLVQAAVAAALREAAERMDNGFSYKAGNRVRALITPDAQAALDRVVAAERERCAKVAESVALPMSGKIAKAQAGYMRGTIAHHIRKGGE